MTHHTQMAYDIKSTVALLSIGRTKLYEEIKSGRLKSIKVGRRTLIPAQSLNEWLVALQQSHPQPLHDLTKASD